MSPLLRQQWSSALRCSEGAPVPAVSMLSDEATLPRASCSAQRPVPHAQGSAPSPAALTRPPVSCLSLEDGEPAPSIVRLEAPFQGRLGAQWLIMLRA